MSLELSTLEIRILLKCHSHMVSKTDITQILRKYPSEMRAQVMERLVALQLISPREMPKLESKKIPIFYEITEDGKQWVKDYLARYPK